jgi:hypothetical protein
MLLSQDRIRDLQDALPAYDIIMPVLLGDLLKPACAALEDTACLALTQAYVSRHAGP